MMWKTHRPGGTLYFDELNGTLNVAQRTVDEMGEEGSWKVPYYVGMAIALMLLKCFDSFDYPRDFIFAFERELEKVHGQERD